MHKWHVENLNSVELSTPFCKKRKCKKFSLCVMHNVHKLVNFVLRTLQDQYEYHRKRGVGSA